MKLNLDNFLSRQKAKARLANSKVLALVFSFTAFTVSLSAWAAEQHQFRFKGTLATALFEAEEQGCIVTTLAVRAFEGTEREGPGKPTTGSSVNVFVEQFDLCAGELLLSVESITPVSASEFQIDKKLASARLTKTVELTDSASGNSLDVSVDLAWTATGQPEVTRNRFYLRTAGRIVHDQSKGTFREASTTGTVSSAPTNVLQNVTEVFADLQSVNEGFRDISKF